MYHGVVWVSQEAHIYGSESLPKVNLTLEQ